MENPEVVEDKEGNADVQLNLPESVLNRIEQLMGDTGQFDSAEFDAISYINKVFPTEQSLSGVEAATAKCEYQLAAVHQDIERLVRAQPTQRAAGQAALQDAHHRITELALQVSEINKKAERSESTVGCITSEIKSLDVAKWNLTSAITALNHVHMLVGGVTSLRTMTSARRYNEILLPLQAIMEVLGQLEGYHDIPSVSKLRAEVYSERDRLQAQILDDFKQAFSGGGGAGGLSVRGLREAGVVCDVLPPAAREQLVQYVVHYELQEYVHLFSPGEECAWLDHIEKRYAWLKRHLLSFEETRGQMFPPHWALSELIADKFCELTRQSLTSLMSSRQSELDVKLLLYAIQKTTNFETLLHKRFTGGEAETPSEWSGRIGACFEPHLSLYIDSLSASLAALLDRFTQEVHSAGAGAGGGGGGGGAVLSSCADLFLFYKKCLVQCAQLSTGQPMLELSMMFCKYLRQYATNVLQARLPPTGTSSVPSLVSNLLLRDDASTHRYSPAEVCSITSVISTAEYCLETVEHLESRLREKISEGLRGRVSLAGAAGVLQRVADAAVQCLVADLDAACTPHLNAIPKRNWAGVTCVGDVSPEICGVVAALEQSVPRLRLQLSSCRKYFLQVCSRFCGVLVAGYVRALYRCGAVSGPGADQLLLDTHRLKAALLDLPALGDPPAAHRPPPTYTKVVIKLMSKAETILKLVMGPAETAQLEPFVVTALQQGPDLTSADLHKILSMKGLKLNKTQLACVDSFYRQHVAADTHT